MTVNDIFEFLNGIAPVNTACDFDNAGILVGDPSAEVNGAVVALDCTASAIKTAIKKRLQNANAQFQFLSSVSGSITFSPPVRE